MNTATFSPDTDWAKMVCPLTAALLDASATIKISQVGVQYRTVEALRNVNCVVAPGRLTGIIGPNGAGKSTLMKAMLGLIPVTGGTVLYGDRP